MSIIIFLLFGCFTSEGDHGNGKFIQFYVDTPETMLLLRVHKNKEVGFFVRKETNPPDSILNFDIWFSNGSYLDVPNGGYTNLGDTSAVFGVRCNYEILIMLMASEIVSVGFRVNHLQPPNHYYITEGQGIQFRGCVITALQNEKVRKWLKL